MEVTKQKPLLVHLKDFEKVLNGYRPSKESLDLFASVPLVMLVGPTAAGRNTLINLLTRTGRYHMIVSDTTRQPRVVNGAEEKNGQVYWFKPEETVLEGLKNGHYIEAAIIHGQQVSGANIAEIKTAQAADAIAIKEIEVNGAHTYRSYNPKALAIFLLPPAFDVWMQRIRGRGNIDDAELRRRLGSAVEEINTALKDDYYQFLVNYEIHEAAQAVDELANGRISDAIKQQNGRDHAQQLLIDVQLYLESTH